MIDLCLTKQKIMKTIQNLIHYQFTQRAAVLGDKAISTLAVIAVFALLILPFILMITRLS